MELIDGHEMPESRARCDYSSLDGWQIGQCILVDQKTCLRVKAYFERRMKWKFTQRQEPGGQYRLWRKV